jgi:methyl-accepting chemotaxis protein
LATQSFANGRSASINSRGCASKTEPSPARARHIVREARREEIEMQLLKNLKISARMGVGFALVLLLLSAMAGLAAWKANRLAQNTTYTQEVIVPSYKTIGSIQMGLNDMRRMASQHMLVTDDAKLTALEAQIAAARVQVEKGLVAYKDMVCDAEDGRMWEKAKAMSASIFGHFDKLRTLKREAQKDPSKLPAAVAYLMGESREAYYDLRQLTDAWYAYNEKIGADYAVQSAAEYREAMLWLGGFFATALLIGIAAAVLITRSITAPIQEAVGVAEAVSRGDLTTKIDAQGRDETAQLLRALGAMNDNLVTIVRDVRSGSEGVATGSSQIATGNADLSQRTEEQASNLQQTAASMEQIASAVKSSAETAQQANQLAAGASEAAAQGGATVGRVVETMEEISAASRKIADIIGVIDGIAFQTNILALNAAVEAARAGEQGRGFAVVASEVRSLAQRSATAAKEIKTLIGASVDKVEDGRRLVSEAGNGMQAIIDQVRKVSDMIAEITAATTEQMQGIGEVNTAVAQLDQTTQQNAALVEESAAASDSLRSQAQRLVEAVGLFRLAA